MLLNKEEIYAIRLLIYFKDEAVCKEVEPSIKKIHISKPHAYKLTRKLKQAGLIASKRGRNGGYHLDRSLSRISLFDVHMAISGRYGLSDRYEDHMGSHILKRLKQIDDNVLKMLKKIRISEFIDDEQE